MDGLDHSNHLREKDSKIKTKKRRTNESICFYTQREKDTQIYTHTQ